MTIREDIETYFGDAITALEENLQAMGINDAEYDSTTGIMALIAQILDIEPAVGGIPIVTSITLNASSVSATVGDSIVLSGKVKADHDDTSVSNVDMVGYLKGASVQLYNGNTLIDTVITDQDGNYSYTWTPSSSGSAVISAIFDGTDDYDSCTSSNVNITISDVNLSISSNKTAALINESITFTATATDGNGNGVAGKTISFVDDEDNIIGTATTNSSGIASVSYSWRYVSYLYIRAIKGTIETSKISVWIIPSTIIVTNKAYFTNWDTNKKYIIICSILDNGFNNYTYGVDWNETPSGNWIISGNPPSESLSITDSAISEHTDYYLLIQIVDSKTNTQIGVAYSINNASNYTIRYSG